MARSTESEKSLSKNTSKVRRASEVRTGKLNRESQSSGQRGRKRNAAAKIKSLKHSKSVSKRSKKKSQRGGQSKRSESDASDSTSERGVDGYEETSSSSSRGLSASPPPSPPLSPARPSHSRSTSKTNTTTKKEDLKIMRGLREQPSTSSTDETTTAKLDSDNDTTLNDPQDLTMMILTGRDKMRVWARENRYDHLFSEEGRVFGVIDPAMVMDKEDLLKWSNSDYGFYEESGFGHKLFIRMASQDAVAAKVADPPLNKDKMSYSMISPPPVEDLTELPKCKSNVFFLQFVDLPVAVVQSLCNTVAKCRVKFEISPNTATVTTHSISETAFLMACWHGLIIEGISIRAEQEGVPGVKKTSEMVETDTKK